MLFPALLQAQSATSSIVTPPLTSVLANRFRLDTASTYLTIVVTRESNSEPLTLVQPDGSKLFARNPVDNVTWWRSDTHELITITEPMIGPWQVRAEGKTVLKVQTFSDIQIRADRLPVTLYQHEQLTFTARLVQKKQPISAPELIKNTALYTVFIPLGKLTPTEKKQLSLPDNSKVKRELAVGAPLSAGRLEDNGQGGDTLSGDGVFSQQLALTMPTGLYWVEIRTGEGVTLPETGQWVEVKTSPLQVLFSQTHVPEQHHVLMLEADSAEVLAGSLQARVEERLPDTSVTIGYRAQTDKQAYKVQIQLPYRSQLGYYSLETWVYLQAKDRRMLSFLLPEQRFRVITNASVRQQQQKLMEQQQIEQDEWQKMLSDLEQSVVFSQQQGMQRMQWVLVSVSLVALLLAFSIWGCIRWRKRIQRRMALMVLQRQRGELAKMGQRDFSTKTSHR
ncbi:choice-of-anchor X domain-containing protein [Plesiomonas sp.]|uniref:choice-of-anchor X domain-containing protein n=1 Tax=Plesiomonas sp. TaxID=2486279 RepID=UPI003F34321D